MQFHLHCITNCTPIDVLCGQVIKVAALLARSILLLCFYFKGVSTNLLWTELLIFFFIKRSSVCFHEILGGFQAIPYACVWTKRGCQTDEKSWLKILWKTPLGSKLLTGILRQFFKFDWFNIVNVGYNSHTTKFRFYGRAEEPLNKHWMGVLCTAYRLLICLEINLTNPFVCENSRLWMFRKIIANILTRP